MTAHFTGRHRRAIRWLRQSLAYCTGSETHVRKVYALLSGSLRVLGELEAALAACLEGLTVIQTGFITGYEPGAVPLQHFSGKAPAPAIDPELHFRAGQVFAQMGLYEQSKLHYMLVQEDISDHYSSVDLAILGPKRFHNLAEVCHVLGQYEEAKTWFKKAIERRFATSALVLFNIALERKDFLEAENAWKAVKAIEGPSEAWAAIGAQLVQAQGRSPDEFLLEASRLYPASVGPTAVLAQRMVDVGQEREAERYLDFLEQMNHVNGPFLRSVIAARHNEFREALAFAERALTLNPEHLLARELKERLGAFVS